VRTIDLSQTISPTLKVFPGSPQPTVVQWNNFVAHGYDSEAVFMSTHTGTHMDAPSHFVPGQASIESIDPQRFVSDAILARVPKKANELIEQSDLEHFDIRKGDAVVLCTGWEKRFRARNYMTDNPGLSGAAAKLLARKKVSTVAIDGPSIDAGADASFTAHKILLGKNILAVENLCNLTEIPSERFTLVVAPLKIRGSTGSPVRALALIL
jgi:kynurenine formamidase